MMNRMKMILSALLMVLVFLQGPAVADGNLHLKFMLPHTGYYPILGPGGVALDSSGNFYVADIATNSILKISSAGVLLATWGGRGSGNGKFNQPYGVAVDSTGQHVYVADCGNNLIQQFTYDAGSGAYTFTSQCDGTVSSSSFYQPKAVAVDDAGNIYVADTGYHRIVKLSYNPADQTYTSLMEWGGYGYDPGQFCYPEGVAVDSSGNVYVGDTVNNRIQKFDAGSSTWTVWGLGMGSGDGYFYYPKGVAVDSTGNVYVADYYNARVQKLDSSGTYVTKWGSSGQGDGQFTSPQGVAVNAAGTFVYVADIGNGRIEGFTYNSADGTYAYASQWRCSGSGDGQFYRPQALAADSAGNIYVADTNNNRIQKFTYDAVSGAYTYATQWGGTGTDPGQFSYPQGLAVDAAGNIFVADSGNNRIQKYDQSTTTWSIFSTSYLSGNWSHPRGVAIDAAGNVFVVDAYHYRVVKLDSSGAYQTLFGWGNSQGDGRFSNPVGVAVDRAGKVYVTDSNNQCVQKFYPNTSGGYSFETSWGFVGSYGISGHGDGQLSGPSGVAVDHSGYVYVADTYNYRVQKFTASGNFRGAWNGFNPGNGQFYGLSGMAAAGGNLYVADAAASSVLIFSAPNSIPQVLDLLLDP